MAVVREAFQEGNRYFANEHWSIPLGWIPIACWFISKAGTRIGSPPEVALMVLLGIFIWTAMDYALRGFLFHMDTDTYWGNTAHFILNGYHHKNPVDGSRLVSAPSVVAVMCFPVYGLVRLCSTPAAAPAVFGGWLLGYVMYDVTQYLLRNQVLMNIKKCHELPFGVSNMGTVLLPYFGAWYL